MIESTVKARGKPKVKLPSLKQAANKKWEDLFAFHLQTAGMGKYFVREYVFHPVRKWRFDFAATTLKIAVEIDGATWTGGRHTRGGGVAQDCEKYSEAAILGWRILRFTPEMIKSSQAIEMIQRALKNDGMGN